MAAEIRDQLGIETRLVGGSGGVFDVFVDGKLVYSKHEADNQFPDYDELIGQLRGMQTR